ncbi:MAG: PGPGW domain-containing protein [candidate division Zixibacteria bacterium]|nr:PGPGW domain-containing protein [candidate division Zixibacteria bacterium]
MLLRILQPIVGWIFVILGVIGIFLPLLQGVLFIVIGLTLLSSRYAFARNLLDKARNRYPAEYARMEQMHDRIMSNKSILAVAVLVLAGLLTLGIYLLVLGVRQLSENA